MTAEALILSDKDMRPLVEDASFMDSAIDAIERATLAFHRGDVRERDIVDQTQRGDPANVAQIHFAAGDDLVCGYQMFAETRGGGPSLPNARFITLLDTSTRQLLALVDYSSLNALRVGASGGLGCRYLAPAGAQTAGILGSSKQARALLQAIRRTVPTLKRARVFSPTSEHRQAFAREMTEWLGLPVEAVATARDATLAADIVGLANDSREPVIAMDWLKPGSLVVSISGGQLPAEVIGAPRIVATTWDSLAAREPYASRVRAGSYSRGDVAADLGDVITGKTAVRGDSSDVVVFELTRINLWAVSIAQWAYEWALRQGTGTPFMLSGG
jgi:alanine dehydrogenase